MALYFPSAGQSGAKGSGAILAEGIQAYDSSDYKRAAQLLASVPEGDTNYTTTQYELALTYVADSQYQKAKDVLLKALEHPQVEKRRVNLLLASVYDYMQEREKGIAEYRKLIAQNPNDHQPWYEIGVTYFRQELIDSAIYYLQQSLLINPSHHRSMQMLGSCYAMQGRLTESWLCLQTSLLSTKNIYNARSVFNLMTGVSTQTDAFSEPYTNRKESISHPLFDEIDAILHARIILNSDYKIKSALSDEPFAKVTYAIMEKLKFDKNDDNFVMQYLVPIWIQLRDQSLADAFLIQAFSGYEIAKIEKLLAGEKKNAAKANETIYNYFATIQGTRILNYEARQKAPLRYRLQSSDGIFYEAHFRNLNDFDEGPIKVYRNGVLAAEGYFDAKGEKTGKWHYYYTSGRLKSIETLVNGKNTGLDTTWYENGQIQSCNRYNADGKSVYTADYNEYGALTEDFELQSADIVRNNVYYESGTKSLSILVSKSVYQNGDYDGWWENGKVKRHFTIKDGKLHGLYREFYEDETLKASYNYKDGKLDGLYTAYHPNGKVSFKVNYSEGLETGLYEGWDEAGLPDVQLEYRKGKRDGKKVYFDQGKEYGFVKYENDLPVAYEFRDEEGKVVASAKSPLNSLKLYYANGNLKGEFPLKEGVINGVVRQYSYGGVLTEETEYVKGLKEGRETAYLRSGKRSYEMTNHENAGNGAYKGFNGNGNLVAEGALEKGEKEGLWSFYNINGKISTKGFYSNNFPSGPLEDYNINGELTSIDYYFEKGIYRLVQFDTSGNKYSDVDFPNGSGTYVLNNEVSKAKWFECKLINGRLSGPYVRWGANGMIQEEGTYLYGKKNGPVTFYAINGVKTTTGFLKEGKRDSTWEFFSDLGEHTSTIRYKDGELEGKRLDFVNGEVQFESNYRNGHRDGEQYIYDAHKHLGAVLYFSEGVLKGYSYEGSDGKLLPRIRFKDGTGKVIAYYANGKKSVELNYEQSTLKGKQSYYFNNGQVAEERNCLDGMYNGDWREYHENGKLKAVTTYKDDEMHGSYKYYDAEGNLVSFRNYFWGTQHGLEEVMDPKTHKVHRVVYRYGQPFNTL